MTVRRGEIYWVDFNPVRGSEIGGVRPALVLQHDLGNRFSPTTVMAAITRTIPPKPYPFVVMLEPEESGLRERSVVNCTQLLTVQKSGQASRLLPPKGEHELRPVGKLDQRLMAQVDEALKYNLGLT